MTSPWTSVTPTQRPLPTKLRLFLIDEASGALARGVLLQGSAEFGPGENEEPGSTEELTVVSATNPPQSELIVRSLGVVATDHTGFAAFDLRSVAAGGPMRHLWISPAARPEARTDVWPAFQSVSAGRAIPLRVNGAGALENRQNLLPAVQQPDPGDWTASPASFATLTVASLGEGDCASLLESNAPTQIYRFDQIIREPAEHEAVLDLAALSPCATEAEAATDRSDARLCYRTGAIIEYEMRWVPAGHGLGEVLYSLPLAPCESVRVAIIDWTRAESAARSEDVAVQEQLLHDQRRDRAIDETVRALLSEWQRGGAVMGAAAGTYSYGAGSIAASLGAGYSTTSSDRSVAADTVQRLADGVRQASSAARALQSTVVVQATQREGERLETRTVTNHNHCHALTVLYFEVVRHFRVETVVSRTRNAILLRHPEQVFDTVRVNRNRSTLAPLLLDATLRPALDALGHDGAVPSIPSSATPRYGNVRRLIVRVTTGDKDPGDPANSLLSAGNIDLVILDSAGQEQSFDFTDRAFWDFAARRHDDVLLRIGQTNTFFVPLDLPLHSLGPVGIHYWRHGEGRWALRGLEITASVEVDRGAGTQLELVRLFQNPAIEKFFNDDGEWWGDLQLPALSTAPVSSPTSPPVSVDALLKHLNDNRDYYNRALWLSEDPNRRARWLGQYRFDRRGQPGRLADFVENRPVDVVGEYVVYPLAGEDLADVLLPDAAAFDAQIISLPTRGAFAEAKLSNCNACEHIDDTRFWDWQQSPCAEAPEIAPLSAGSRARDQDVSPSAPPAGTIGVESPPAAPDPTGMANVLDLLGKSDLFRDMSTRTELASVMQHLVDGAVQLEIERQRQQTERQRIQQQSQGGPSGSPNASSVRTSSSSSPSAPPTTSPLDADRQRQRTFQQAENAVDRAENADTISSSTAAEYRRDLLDAQVKQTTNPLPSERASSRPRVPTGSTGTEHNPWIIDNFALSEDNLPGTTAGGQSVVPLLDRIAAELRRHPDNIIHIVGHTDRSGTETSNRGLALERAMAMSEALRDRGLPGGPRMRAGGEGETNPRGLPDDDDAQHNRHDRRVEIWFGASDADVSASLRCNILYDVPLVAQPNKFSCWAASVSMLYSYHRHISILPTEVYRRAGREINSNFPWDEQIERLESAFGFRPIPEMTSPASIPTSPTTWCDWLTRYGPLYLTVAGDPLHAVVIRGLVADALGATIYLNNPYDIRTRFDDDPIDFHPPNHGWRGRLPLSEFLTDFYSVDLTTAGRRDRVMYLPPP